MSRIEEWTKPTPYGHGIAYIDVDDHNQVLVNYDVFVELLTDLGWTRTAHTTPATPPSVSPGNTYKGRSLTAWTHSD